LIIKTLTLLLKKIHKDDIQHNMIFYTYEGIAKLNSVKITRYSD